MFSTQPLNFHTLSWAFDPWKLLVIFEIQLNTLLFVIKTIHEISVFHGVCLFLQSFDFIFLNQLGFPQ